jgi:hypothetical protein
VLSFCFKLNAVVCRRQKKASRRHGEKGGKGKRGNAVGTQKIFAKDFPFAGFNVAGQLCFTNADAKVFHAFSIFALRAGVDADWGA